MSLINENFLELQDSYLFSTIAKKVAKFTEENADKNIIKLGIGDVTKPIVPACLEAMHKAVDEIGTKEDALAIKYLCRSGVKFVTTMHGDSLEDIMNSNIKELVLAGYIDTVILLSKVNGIGTVHKIYNDFKSANINNLS